MSSTATTKTVKKTVKKSETAAAQPAVEAVQVAAPVVQAAPAPVAEVAAPAAEVAAPVEKKRKEPAERKPLTNESVVHDLEDLVGLISGALADEAQLKKPAKVLRSVQSRVRKLLQDVPRLLRKTSPKAAAPRDPAKLNNSGLMKPVRISADLSRFMGVAVDTPQSRVAVTNSICAYVKQHELQNPQNKREIRPDAALATLLGYAGDKAQQPLTYFYIQQLIQPHFIK
jgi:upstream activation factor subunit UAF30